MNQKGIASIVIVLIVIGILVICGGIWYYQSQKETDETAGWKTYRNEKYKFTIQHPSNWKVVENYAPEQDIIKFSDENEPVFTIATNKPNLKSFDDWSKQFPLDYPVTIIDGIKAIELPGIGGCQRNLEFFHEGQIFAFLDDVSGCAGQGDLQKSVISTFKFTKPDETANWQTYRNKEHGYEIKYPIDWKVEEGSSPRSPSFSYHKNDSVYCQFDNVVTPKSDNSAEMNWYRQNGYKETEYNVAGIPSVRFTKLAAENKRPIDVIYFTKDPNDYRISLQSSASQQENCVSVFNQILSTFKFTK